jgi:hypothetical protein
MHGDLDRESPPRTGRQERLVQPEGRLTTSPPHIERQTQAQPQLTSLPHCVRLLLLQPADEFVQLSQEMPMERLGITTEILQGSTRQAQVQRTVGSIRGPSVLQLFVEGAGPAQCCQEVLHLDLLAGPPPPPTLKVKGKGFHLVPFAVRPHSAAGEAAMPRFRAPPCWQPRSSAAHGSAAHSISTVAGLALPSPAFLQCSSQPARSATATPNPTPFVRTRKEPPANR